MLTAQKNNLDLVSIIESAGVELKRSGPRHVRHCPFHEDRTPSFFVFDDGHFHCFSCSAHGDVIDFVQKMYGLSFQESLKHLGIEKGKINPEMKEEIERRKIEQQKAKAKKQFKVDLQNTLQTLISATQKTIRHFKTIDDLEKYGDILQPLPWWEHCLDVLSFGTIEEQDRVCEQFKDMEVIPVEPFFKPGFDYNKFINDFFEKRDADEWTINLHIAGCETGCAEAPASG